MCKNLQFLPFTLVSSMLSLSYCSCAFMSSPTRLHPTGTKEAAEIQTPASRTREDQTIPVPLPAAPVLALSWLQTGSGRNRKYEESASAGVTGMD